MGNGLKVCHFTSVHDAHDDRIYLKECVSLKEAGYKVFLVAKGESTVSEGIKIIGCGKPKNRFDRFFLFSRKVYKKAREINCDVYHFHDPELLPYGLKLKKQGKTVIFDSHEDIPAQILDKYWIPKSMRKSVSMIYKKYETYVVQKLDAVIAATAFIAECFEARAKRVIEVNNYPRLDDILFYDKPFCERKKIVCYVGGISEIRGEKIMVEAMREIDADLVLAGDHEAVTCQSRNVYYLGQISREDVNHLYEQSRAGLCLLLPTANYINSVPIKLFEYMAAGIPFVASDFPHWRKIIESEECGICVDCKNIDCVREAIKQLVDDPHKAQDMGWNGRKAVETKYNWEVEKEKLIGLYTALQGIDRK